VNGAQKLWWRQAQSDLALFIQLRRSGAQECHLLHYLQMATEKLSKAYLWRSGHAPPKTHTGFVRFLKALLDRRDPELERVAKTLAFGRPEDLDKWVASVQTLAYSLQNIAPAEAKDGPNPEYPWPHENPVHCPSDHAFALWNQLSNSGQGRKLIEFIDRAITRFDTYA
jgi:HEPN domain-containing protein